MKKIAYIILLVLLYSCSCNNSQKSKNTEEVSNQIRPFPMINVPTYLTSEKESTTYIVQHFWDKYTDTTKYYNNSDSTILNGVKIKELRKSISSFAFLLWKTDNKTAKKALENTFIHCENLQKKYPRTKFYNDFINLISSCFYTDPQSPFRNEDFYLTILQLRLLSNFETDEEKFILDYDKKLCSINPVNGFASDFSFKDIKNRVQDLYDIKTKFTILFFSNPSCQNCKQIKERLEQNQTINNAIKDKTLTILDLYIENDKIQMWKDYAKNIKKNWICGYDHNYRIRKEQLYNIRATPSLYLLDSEKKVILKDTDPYFFFNILEQLVSTSSTTV